MEITEVRIKLMEDSDDRLQAFCSITFDDCFVVRDLKIIEGANGPFVAMPSRKLTAHCPYFGTKNHLRSQHCNQCGSRLKDQRSNRDGEGRTKLYADIAHPINSKCREMIQNRVIEEYRIELDRAKQPGYVSRYDDTYGDLDGEGVPELCFDQRGAQAIGTQEPQVQGAESETRGPHRARASQTASQAASGRLQKDDGFGAGIF